MGFTPSMELQLAYEDNVRRLPDDFRKSDSIATLKPQLPLAWRFGKHDLDLVYKGAYAVYASESELDYSDHELQADLRLDHSYRLNSEYRLFAKRSHDEPGASDRLGVVVGEVDKWNQWGGILKATYGRTATKGQIVLKVEADQRDYTNNARDYLNRTRLSSTGTFFYRIRPNSRLLFELNHADYSYTETSGTLFDQSSRELRYLTGITWEATAKTSGTFKIGYRDKTYDDSHLQSQTGIALWLQGAWEPNSFTRADIGATRDSQESNQIGGGAYVRTQVSARVRHAITARAGVKAGLIFGTDAFNDRFDREDTRRQLALGVEHSARRWLTLGAEYRYEERNSSLDIYDFKDNILMVSAEVKTQ